MQSLIWIECFGIFIRAFLFIASLTPNHFNFPVWDFHSIYGPLVAHLIDDYIREIGSFPYRDKKQTILSNGSTK